MPILQKDFHIDQHAEVANKLMLRLGYKKYSTDQTFYMSSES